MADDINGSEFLKKYFGESKPQEETSGNEFLQKYFPNQPLEQKEYVPPELSYTEVPQTTAMDISDFIRQGLAPYQPLNQVVSDDRKRELGIEVKGNLDKGVIPIASEFTKDFGSAAQFLSDEFGITDIAPSMLSTLSKDIYENSTGRKWYGENELAGLPPQEAAYIQALQRPVIASVLNTVYEGAKAIAKGGVKTATNIAGGIADVAAGQMSAAEAAEAATTKTKDVLSDMMAGSLASMYDTASHPLERLASEPGAAALDVLSVVPAVKGVYAAGKTAQLAGGGAASIAGAGLKQALLETPNLLGLPIAAPRPTISPALSSPAIDAAYEALQKIPVPEAMSKKTSAISDLGTAAAQQLFSAEYGVPKSIVDLIEKNKVYKSFEQTGSPYEAARNQGWADRMTAGGYTSESSAKLSEANTLISEIEKVRDAHPHLPVEILELNGQQVSTPKTIARFIRATDSSLLPPEKIGDLEYAARQAKGAFSQTHISLNPGSYANAVGGNLIANMMDDALGGISYAGKLVKDAAPNFISKRIDRVSDILEKNNAISWVVNKLDETRASERNPKVAAEKNKFLQAIDSLSTSNHQS